MGGVLGWLGRLRLLVALLGGPLEDRLVRFGLGLLGLAVDVADGAVVAQRQRAPTAESRGAQLRTTAAGVVWVAVKEVRMVSLQSSSTQNFCRLLILYNFIVYSLMISIV